MNKPTKIIIGVSAVIVLGTIGYFGFKKNGWFRKKSSDNGYGSDSETSEETQSDSSSSTNNYVSDSVNTVISGNDSFPFQVNVSKGDKVKKLQTLINKSKKADVGSIDGDFGVKTLTAVNKILSRSSKTTTLSENEYNRLISMLS